MLLGEFWIGALSALVAVTLLIGSLAAPEVLRWHPSGRLYPAALVAVGLLYFSAICFSVGNLFPASLTAFGLLIVVIVAIVRLYEETLTLRDKELSKWTSPTASASSPEPSCSSHSAPAVPARWGGTSLPTSSGRSLSWGSLR